MPTTKFCQGISDISDTYMGFILDQWGVLHDGRQVYDGVLECLEQLRNRHKTIIILSNSGAPAAQNKEKLTEIGIPENFYDYIVTSGELIRIKLQDQAGGLLENYGQKCYVFGTQDTSRIFEETDIDVVEDIQEADFMLIGGIRKELVSLDDYAPILKEAVRLGVKAICTNPDSHALLGASYLMGPGLIARRFQDYGGVVQYIGKPHAPIFKYCIELFQKHEVYPSHTVMVGDTMAHDIMGAHYMNIDTCLVKTGMHAGVFKNCTSPAEVDHTLDILINHYNRVRPRYLVERFEWGKALPDRKHKVHKKHVRRKKPEGTEPKEEVKEKKSSPRKKPTPRKAKG